MLIPPFQQQAMRSLRLTPFMMALAAVLLLVGCQSKPADGAAATGDAHAHEAQPGELPAGVIAIPASVRDHLGITFVPAERRAVRDTLRMPGSFESTPAARAQYRSAAAGRVEVLVSQYERVEPGRPLYRLESPEWRRLQQEMAGAELAARLIVERTEVQVRAVAAAREALQVWEDRVAKLEGLRAEGASQASQLAEAQGQSASARVALAEALQRQQELIIETLALRDEATGGNPRFEMALRSAATLFGTEEAWLLEQVEGQPRWKHLHRVEVAARQSGVVESIGVPSGGYVEESGLIMATLDPAAVRFRAFALQADLAYITEELEVSIVPPQGSVAPLQAAIPAMLRLGTEADADERTFDLIAEPHSTATLPGWARPGVAAFLEVTVAGGEEKEWAIPLSSVIQDGLDRVYFVRDRQNPDQVRRMVGDLGWDDGRWVTVGSGLRAGDEVVLDGVYELKLAGTGKAAAGGHFHADGTFHDGKH